jgi:hypothetical protein
MSGDDWIKGYCPMGCGPTLKRRPYDDKVICQQVRCPRPAAVAELLSDRETEHIAQFTGDGFTVRHPLRERLDDHLLRCLLHEFLFSLSRQPVPDGRYRMVYSEHQGEYTYEYVGPALLPGEKAA